MSRIALVAILFVGVALASSQQYSPQLLSQFNAWQLKYKKVYTEVADFDRAIQNFAASIKRVEANNKRTGGNYYGLTKFADLTPAEFKKMYLNADHKNRVNGNPHIPKSNVLPLSKVKAPASYDWRTHTPNVLTGVYDQGQCGSCWAFSATENIESMWALAGNDLVSLSREQIVDCDTVDAGCGGGDTPTAYEYVMQAGGLEAESSYPYTAGGGDSGSCNFEASNVVATITNFTWAIPECTSSCNSQNMADLQSKLATVAPFAICVYAEPWMDYNGGVFADASCTHAYTDLDHCVQLVGYTSGYWIVRNSWNTDWGENGYIYISTKVAKGNLCGVMDEVNFVAIH
jgi:cathepsin F